MRLARAALNPRPSQKLIIGWIFWRDSCEGAFMVGGKVSDDEVGA